MLINETQVEDQVGVGPEIKAKLEVGSHLLDYKVINTIKYTII
jgi:hypothetical protein